MFNHLKTKEKKFMTISLNQDEIYGSNRNLAKNTDEDKCWLQCNELNRDNLKTQVSNRKLRRGGGLAIVYKSNIEVKCLKEDQLNTFQFTIWKVRCNNDNIMLIAIYHPPYTTSNPITNTTFIDEYKCCVTQFPFIAE